MKIKHWDKRKEKKARFKRSLARAKKRGMLIYGGFVPLNLTWLEMEEEVRKCKARKLGEFDNLNDEMFQR